MNHFRKVIIFLICLLFLSCGIEEYYYLPQIPEGNVRSDLISAEIRLPSISSYYYAVNYSIYYRIYISDNLFSGSITSSQRALISSTLNSDFNAIYPSTDPTNLTASTSVNSLFTNRNYFELELNGADIKNTLSPGGGTLRIMFPTAIGDLPYASLNSGNEYYLHRSNLLISPEPDMFFRNSPELNDPAKATSNINADVSGRSGLTQRYAYVSMYVVAVGIDPVSFTPIYSKPTHISIFKLPER